MRRSPDETDAEWQIKLRDRKRQAAKTMLISDLKKGFVTQRQTYEAAAYWQTDTHSAEVRLLRGELPDGLFEIFADGEGNHQTQEGKD